MSHPLLPLYDAVDDGIGRAMVQNNKQVGKRPSCHVRCTGCCHMLVNITLAEALYIVEAAAAYPARSKVFKESLQECGRQADRLDKADMDHAEWRKTRTPCALLKDGKCTAYRERPVACRAFFSYSDPALCHEPGATIVQTNVQPFIRFFEEHAKSAIDEGRLPNLHGPLPAMLLLAADLQHSCPRETPRQVMMRHGGNAAGISVRWMHLRRDLENYPEFYKRWEETPKTGHIQPELLERIKPYPMSYYETEAVIPHEATAQDVADTAISEGEGT